MEITRETDQARELELLNDAAEERLYEDLRARARWVVAQDAVADAKSQLKAKRAELKAEEGKVKSRAAAVEAAEKRLTEVKEKHRDLLAEVDDPWVLYDDPAHTAAEAERGKARHGLAEAERRVKWGQSAIEHAEADIEALERWIESLAAVEKPSLAAWLE